MENEKPKLRIDPENKMSQKRLSELMFDWSEDNKPIVEIKEGESTPLYIYVRNFYCKDLEVNLMATICYHIKEKEIEVRGRARFSSGRKLPFHTKKKWSVGDYEKLKEEIERASFAFGSWPDITESSEPTILEFTQDESADSIMQKMNDSGEFDIGVVHGN